LHPVHSDVRLMARASRCEYLNAPRCVRESITEEFMTFVHRDKGAAKELDVDLLVFIERYANDLIKWDLISFFAQNPDVYDTAGNVAHHIGRSLRVVRSELSDLAMLGILEWDSLNGDHIYQLTHRPDLRRLALKFARHLDGS
jgi:hypothetical protein